MPNGADEELEEDNQGTPTEENTNNNDTTTDDSNDDEVVDNPVELNIRGNNNKLFQARVFLEKNKQVYGAEVVLFDKNAEEINRILITDETDYEAFNKYITNMNKAYVPYTTNDVGIVDTLSHYDEDSDEYIEADSRWSELSKKNDLKTILENKISLTDENNHITSYLDGGQTIINATHLNGLDSGEFSKLGHNHDDRYLDPSHSYTVGVNGSLGHLRLVDNLTTSETNGGQVLSANQGKELNTRLEKVERKYGWRTEKWGKYVTYHINEDLHLIAVDYDRENFTGLKRDKGKVPLHTKFPYKPTKRVISPLYRGDVSFYIGSDGSMNLWSLSYLDSINIYCHLVYYYK